MNGIIAELERYIAEKILNRPEKRIMEGEALLSSGLVDSFHLMDLALFVEDTYGVKLEDTELNSGSFDNLAQLASLIQARQK